LLFARLDRLPPAKQVAQIGAVMGREFSHNLPAAAAELSEAQLTKGLNELVAAGLVFRRVTARGSSTTGLAAIQPRTSGQAISAQSHSDV
jgi:predicted ATPase